MIVTYTLESAAAKLHKSRRWLQEFLYKHPADERGEPFYSPLGGSKTFTQDDLGRLLAYTKELEKRRLVAKG